MSLGLGPAVPLRTLGEENGGSHAVSRDRADLIVFLYTAGHVTSTSLRLIEWEDWGDLKDCSVPLCPTDRETEPPRVGRTDPESQRGVRAQLVRTQDF